MLDCRAREIDVVAMRLMLLRHAKTEKAAPDMHDRDRALNPRGRKDGSRIGAYIAHHALIPDAVIVSPARRTQETWALVASALSTSPPMRTDDRLYENTAADIIAIIEEGFGPRRCLLLVGHNPSFHDAARLLIGTGDVGARERLHEAMPTGALAVIDFPGGNPRGHLLKSGRLERFVTPRSLREATD